MELKTLSIAELEARKAELAKQLEAALTSEDVDIIEADIKAVKDELEARKALESRRAELRKLVAGGAGQIVAKGEDKQVETRNTKAYIDAFARYIKTGRDDECRALLTENVSGSLPVPEIVEGFIRTAWERDAILSRIRRTYIRGNLKVPFELVASPAVEHVEGTTAVTEETLTLGIVTLIPKNIKKMVKFSDEVMAMGGEEFLRYVYDEVTYQVFKELKAKMIADVVNSPAASDADEVGVPQVDLAPSVTTIAKAAAYLSDEAENIAVIINRLSEAAFLDAQAAGNFNVDPWAGLPRLYTTALPAYSAASDEAVYAIVGDLAGLQANFPEGDDIVLKFDDMTEAEEDLIKVVGRIYAGHDVTGPGRLVNVRKPAAVTT